MTRQISRQHNGFKGGFNGAEEEWTEGMAAFGEVPARDREFEALLQRAAAFQNAESGCKLRGETV